MDNATINTITQFSPLLASLVIVALAAIPQVSKFLGNEQAARLRREERMVETMDKIAAQMVDFGRTLTLMVERIGGMSERIGSIEEELAELRRASRRTGDHHGNDY